MFSAFRQPEVGFSSAGDVDAEDMAPVVLNIQLGEGRGNDVQALPDGVDIDERIDAVTLFQHTEIAEFPRLQLIAENMGARKRHFRLGPVVGQVSGKIEPAFVFDDGAVDLALAAGPEILAANKCHVLGQDGQLLLDRVKPKESRAVTAGVG